MHRNNLTSYFVGTLTDDNGTNTANCASLINTDCTLRDAITAANTGTDFVLFEPGLTGTIVLTNGTLTLANSVTITGPTGSGIAVDGNNAVRVLLVNSGVTANLNNLTIQHGNLTSGGGAGIVNSGLLVISHSVFLGNNANAVSSMGGGAIANVGTLTVNDSTFTGNQTTGTVQNSGGGAIVIGSSSGPTNIARSTFTSNTGTAITQFSSSAMTITDSLFLNNTNSFSYGGAIATASGAGLTTLANCTFAGNSSPGFGGGAMVAGGNISVTNSTFVNNGAGDDNGATLNLDPNIVTSLTNTIIASGGAATPIAGLIHGSASNNLIDSASNNGGLADGPNGNIIGHPALLGPLGNYTGPTKTVPLLPGSLAIDAGTATGAPSADARGIARVGNVDIGAFESRGFSLSATGGASQVTIVGNAFPSSLQATASSAFSEPVQGGTVTFTAPGSGASAVLNGNPATINASGVASVTASANSVAGGPYNVSATTIGGSTAATFALTNNPGAATTLVVSGYPSPTVAGASHTLTVTAKDSFGNTAIGYVGTMHFTSSDPQAVLPANATLTNGTGSFAATLKTTGSQSIIAADTVNGSVEGVQQGITVTPPAATTLAVTVASGTFTAGTSFSITVTAKDSFGNTATGYTGTVSFTSSDGQAVLPAAHPFVAGDNGTFTFTGAALKTAGSQTITAGDGSRSGAVSLTVTPSGVSTLAIVSSASSAQSGAPLSLTVTAKDAFGNTATGYTGTVHFTSTDGAATLPANYLYVAADQGSHTFAATLRTVGDRTVTASDGTRSATTAPAITITTGTSNALAVTGTPASIAAGTPFSVTVTAKDANGNTITGYTGTVSFASSDNTATLPAPYQFQVGDNGAHTFTNLVTLKTAGAQSVTVTDGMLTGGANVTVNTAAVSTLALTGTPASTVAGTPFSVTVTAKDGSGNTITGYTGTVSLSSTDGQATLPAAHPFVAGDGGAFTFSGVILKTPGAQTITASDGTLTGNRPLTVLPAAAASFTVQGESSVVAGAADVFTVTARDANGNVATGYAGTVHITSDDPAAALPGDYLFTNVDQGVHTFTATLKTVGTRKLTVTDMSTSAVGEQTGIIVAAGPATQFSLTGAATIKAGAGYSLTVTAKDAFSNVAVGYRGTAQLVTSDAHAFLPASHTFTAAENGVYVFVFGFNTAGSQSLTATDVGSASITGTMNVTVTGPGISSPANLTAVTPISGPSAGGTTVTITGTGLTGATVTFGGVAADPATIVVNPAGTSLTVVTPAHAVGTVDVVVATGQGSTTIGHAYTYLPPGGAPPVPAPRPPIGGSSIGGAAPAPAGR